MRALLEKQRHDEIERYRKKLKDFNPEQLAIVDQITESLVNKILHNPITQLKGMAHDPRGADFAEIARKLFNLKSSSGPSGGPSSPEGPPESTGSSSNDEPTD
jgi:glutamyl-tRNA reductase